MFRLSPFEITHRIEKEIPSEADGRVQQFLRSARFVWILK